MSVATVDEQAVDILRFITAGSVDDGKSTLIGRLLYESKSLFEDQVNSIKTHGKGVINFANLTDGLKAEREQGITIDVAYRYFSTPRRRFIIADTPGHVQYTRNMITAASNTNLAVILVDATCGITEQTRRHTYLSFLLGIRHLVVCVNKMDLVDHSKSVFDTIWDQFLTFAGVNSDTTSDSTPESRANFESIDFIPISALQGDNLVAPSSNIAWYEGLPLLSHLENIEIADDKNTAARFPVQWVIKSKKDVREGRFRGYAGQVHGGTFRVGDHVIVHPSGRKSRVKEIYTLDGSLDSARAPNSVTILLEDELDIGRGDILTHPGFEPHSTQSVNAIVCWMHEEPLQIGRTYSIKHSAKSTRVKVSELHSRVEISTLARTEAIEKLNLNEIGFVSLSATSTIVYDTYRQNRLTGSFIIVDELTNATAGAGMFLSPNEPRQHHE